MNDYQKKWLMQLKAAFDTKQLGDAKLAPMMSADLARTFPEVFMPGIIEAYGDR